MYSLLDVDSSIECEGVWGCVVDGEEKRGLFQVQGAIPAVSEGGGGEEGGGWEETNKDPPTRPSLSL